MSDELPIKMFDRRGNKRAVVFKTTGNAGPRELTSLRLPLEMLQKLDALAHAGYRSRNSEIQRRLEASLANESIDEHCVIVTSTAGKAK